MTEVRIHSFLTRTDVEGPGTRACVWVQGCSIRCRGCFNSHMWPQQGGRVVEVKELASQMNDATGIEGVTFLGGEPFEQAEALAELGSRVRAAGLSVLTFSGYEYDVLVNASRSHWDELLAVTDLLIDGPFDRSQPDAERPWVGSRNQGFRFLSPRYLHLAEQMNTISDGLEVRITRDGRVRINGMCSDTFLRSVRRDVGRLRAEPAPTAQADTTEDHSSIRL